MKKLFIIGNGFDLEHKLPTSYYDFKLNLEKYNGVKEGNQFSPPSIRTNYKGLFEYDINAIADFWYNIINESLYQNYSGKDENLLWNNFEECLFDLSYDDCFGNTEVIEEDGVENVFKTSYNNEDVANDIYDNISYLSVLFEEWIKSIKINHSKPKNKFKSIFSEKDYFLTFNYTTTLEDIYGITNVEHIHGIIGEELIFGHGNNKNLSERYFNDYPGAETILNKIDNRLKKDVKSIFEKREKFFECLRDIDEIYVIGFSFADVDLYYIKKIIERTPNISWTFFDYNNDSGEKIKKLKALGYYGVINIYI